MHICMLLTKPYPFDIRIRKEVKSLLAAGHEITLLCHKLEGEQSEEVVDGIRVCRHVPQNGLMDKITFLTTEVHPSWERALREVIENASIDAIHVHDLAFVDTGLSVGDRFDLPVVADLHENYPEAVRQWRKMVNWPELFTAPMKLADQIGFPVIRYKRIERRCIREVDRVITVTEEAKRHYVHDCDADPENVQVVSNRADTDALDEMSTEPIDHDGFLISYVGSFGPHRGIETAIEAMPRIVDAIPDAQLLLVGSAGEERYEQKLHSLCETHDVADSVTFTGWVDFELVPSYIAASDICLVLHRSTAHTETTIPHKLFQYMTYRRPLIVTDVAPLERVVQATDSGIVIPAGDHTAVADAVEELHRNPTLREAFGERGRTAVENTYNWENEGEKLRALYRGLTDP